MTNNEKEHPLVRKLFNGYNEKFLKLKVNFNHIVLENIAAGDDPIVAVTKILTEIKRLIVNIELCVTQLNMTDVDKDLILHNLYVDFDECIDKHDEHMKLIKLVTEEKIPSQLNAKANPKKMVDLIDVSVKDKRMALVIFVKEHYNFNIKTTSTWFKIPMSTIGKDRQYYLKLSPSKKSLINEVIEVMKNSCKNVGELSKFSNEWFKS